MPITSSKEAESLLLQLTEFYGQPVMPVRAFCDKFQVWLGALRDARKRQAVDGSDYDRFSAMLRHAHETMLDVTKSNLLHRLLYRGEELRTQMCPKHKGVWSGCATGDKKCLFCMSGGNITGWVFPKEPTALTKAVEAHQAGGRSKEPTEAPPPTPIYLVTTVGWKEGREDYSVCVGWFQTFEEAEEIVVGNYGAITEDLYFRWAVITPTEPGLYPFNGIDSSHWYEFVKRDPTHLGDPAYPGSVVTMDKDGNEVLTQSEYTAVKVERPAELTDLVVGVL